MQSQSKKDIRYDFQQLPDINLVCMWLAMVHELNVAQLTLGCKLQYSCMSSCNHLEGQLTANYLLWPLSKASLPYMDLN